MIARRRPGLPARRRLGTIVAALVVAVGLPSAVVAYTAPGRTEVIPNAGGDMPAWGISGNGRFIVVTNSEMRWWDGQGREITQDNVWLVDRSPGPAIGGGLAGSRKYLISMNSKGDVGEANIYSGGSTGGPVSDDGRFVAFSSTAPNLVPGDTNNTADVFLRDRTKGTTEIISIVGDGSRDPGGGTLPAMTPDARLIAFRRGGDIYLRDRAKPDVQLVSVTLAGRPSSTGTSVCATAPSISTTGRFVAFASASPDLVTGDANGQCDVFVRDRALRVTELVSVDSYEAPWSFPSRRAAISGDGRYVAFASSSPLVPARDVREPSGNQYAPIHGGYSAAGMGGGGDIYVRDRRLGVTRRASVTSWGLGGAQPSADYPAISRDGRHVFFTAVADQEYQQHSYYGARIFRHDLRLGATTMVSVNKIHMPAQGESRMPLPTRDGTTVVFTSEAHNMVGENQGADQGNTNSYLRILGSDLSVVDVTATRKGKAVTARGAVRLAGGRIAIKGDRTDDGGTGARDAGAELTGIEVLHRPEQQDLFFRLPLVYVPTGGPSAALTYGVSFRIGKARYLATLEQPGKGTRLTDAERVGSSGYRVPLARLFRCAATCTETRVIEGAVGSTGVEAVISIPEAALGRVAKLTNIEAFTSASAEGTDPVQEFDRVAAGSAVVPAVSLRVGAGSPQAKTSKVRLRPVKPSKGVFSVPIASRPQHRVVTKLCYGRRCTTLSKVVRVQEGS